MAKGNTKANRHNGRDATADDELGPFVVGVFLGGVIGAIAAFWFAPQSGKDTRHEMQEKGSELRNDVEHAAADARRRVEGESVDESIREGKAEARRYQAMTQR